MLDTWQWLMARATQLALLFPAALAGGISRTLLWRKLAVGATTSLYMKATALAHVLAPITSIQTMSISIWTKGQELYLLLGTHVLYIQNHTETALCSCQHKAAKGMTHFPTGGFEDEAKSREGKEEVSLLSCGIAQLRLKSNCRNLGFKILQYFILSYSNVPRVWHIILLSPDSPREEDRSCFTVLCVLSEMNYIFPIGQSKLWSFKNGSIRNNEKQEENTNES